MTLNERICKLTDRSCQAYFIKSPLWSSIQSAVLKDIKDKMFKDVQNKIYGRDSL